MDPKTLTIGPDTIQQKKLSIRTVKELNNTRQKDETLTVTDNQTWLLSMAFFGDADHIDEIEGAVPYADLLEFYDNVLAYNKLSRAGTGESPAAADQAGSTSPSSAAA
jgi:hypothetical protein